MVRHLACFVNHIKVERKTSAAFKFLADSGPGTEFDQLRAKMLVEVEVALGSFYPLPSFSFSHQVQ
jgi:hypothetical protein